MPKLKTHSGAKKRFKRLGSGKVKRFHANGSHNLSHKNSRRMRIIKSGGTIHKRDMEKIDSMLLHYARD